MNKLYPLKFSPIIKEKVWGGSKLKNRLNKSVGKIEKAGESWEISSLEDNLSVVENGFLKGNNIQELIEVYMGDLVGDKIYDEFGLVFPLLVKFIDANDYLSIQVHPDDEMAMENHNSFGKTEMWYVVEADKEAELIVGFNQTMNQEKYLQNFGSGTLPEILNIEKVAQGDVFFIPAGRIHATGPGVLFAEIQQTADITYRIYDWERLGIDGKLRDLHTEHAIEALDFEYQNSYKTNYSISKNESIEVANCKYFTTNVMDFDKAVVKNYNWLDSFVILMATKGDTQIDYSDGETLIIKQGETYLLPAIIDEIVLKPIANESRLLEVYIP
ncbi:MAG: mannose-6-phosphate isomerase [Salinivirgaceae bacterium]|jgi:mannose-6-phosphate isomerase|nr:mannose-6-phosphate isomerase [Salinivirgaceae bacterium]